MDKFFSMLKKLCIDKNKKDKSKSNTTETYMPHFRIIEFFDSNDDKCYAIEYKEQNSDNWRCLMWKETGEKVLFNFTAEQDNDYKWVSETKNLDHAKSIIGAYKTHLKKTFYQNIVWEE